MTPAQAAWLRIDGDIAYVELTKDYTAIIDAEDAPIIGNHQWYAAIDKRSDGSVRTVYAARSSGPRSNQKIIHMHRAILRPPTGFEVDHIDGNGLNNIRANLRFALRCENTRNRRTPITNTSGAKGVSWSKSHRKWQAIITVGGKAKFLGRFANMDAAKNAYALASAELHGSFGRQS